MELLTDWLQVEVFTRPTLGLINLLAQLTKFRETHLSIYYKGFIKGYKLTAKMKRYIGQGLEGSPLRASVPMELGCATLTARRGILVHPLVSLHVISSPKAPMDPYQWRLHWIGMIEVCATV